MEGRIYERSIETAIGRLLLRADKAGVVEIRFGAAEPRTDAADVLLRAECELREYFAGMRRQFSVPLHPSGTDFQLRVWNALKEIPYGETVSYGELAKRIGNPKTARAVGMANHCNPIPVIVPCHRVIGANGRLTGYAGGLDVKQKLLELERGYVKI